MRIHPCMALIGLLVSIFYLASCTPLLPGKSADNLAAYRLEMLPEAKDQVEQVGPVPRYDVRLVVDPDRLTISGTESVLFTNTYAEALGELYFRLYPNLPAYSGDLRLTKARVGAQEVTPTYEANRSAVRIPLPIELPPGRQIQVDLAFTVRVNHYDEGRVLMGESKGILSLPNCYPMLAVRENGAWKLSIGPEFADAAFSETALYQVSIDVPTDMVVVSSGVVQDVTEPAENAPKGRHILHCVTGPVREFGLIMSRFYQKQSLKTGEIEVNSYYLPQDAAGGYSALWRAAAALRVYSDAFGDYPYTKFDVAEAPLLKHGMEYPTLIFVGTDVYGTERQKMEVLVAHETAHQWWYNLVGSDPVNNPAVDEALAEYSLMTYYETLYGKKRAEAEVTTRWQEPYDYAKKQGWDAPVEQPASGFTKDNYEPIVYAKGSLLYDQLRQAIGRDAFNAAVRHYLQTYMYRIAPPGALVGIASSTSSRDLESLAQKWKDTGQPTPTPTPGDQQ